MSKATTGILTLAVGKATFTQLATNLACNVQASMEGVPVALITDDKSKVGDADLSLFSEFIIVPDLNAFRLKTQLYDLSPFTRTLFIDADSLWNCDHSLEVFFALLKDHEFCIAELDAYTKREASRARLDWVSLPKLWDFFKIPEDSTYPALQASAIYWKRSRRAKEIFNKAFKAYERFSEAGIGKHAGYYPDDPAWCIAMAQMGTRPDVDLSKHLYTVQGPSINRTAALKCPLITWHGSRFSTSQTQFYGAVARQGWKVFGRGYDFRK